MQLVIVFQKTYLKVLDDPFKKQLFYVPAVMDLREYGLVTPPKDIGFSACGSGAAAVASLAESNILRGWNYWKENPFIQRHYLSQADKTSSNIDISMQYILNNSNFYSKSKGYYCTQPAEYSINDLSQEETLQFAISSIMQYKEKNRQFNPEPEQIEKILVDPQDPEVIAKKEEFVQPFYKDPKNNSLVLLYHTQFFSLSGYSSIQQDTVDLMKQYLARGITLITQIHLGSDKQYETFINYQSSNVFAAECQHVYSKYQSPSYDKIEKDIAKNGYNKMQQRMLYANIVGYGTKEGQDVWIVKFPFGTGFGNLGYMYFPILNNTLCMEEFIATALPEHVELDSLNALFTNEKAQEMGLNKIYSIENLIAQTFNDKPDELTDNDQYSNTTSFGINEQIDMDLIVDEEVASITSGTLNCQLSRDDDGQILHAYDVFSQNCSATVYMQLLNGTAQEFAAQCYTFSGQNLVFTASDEYFSVSDDNYWDGFMCIVQNIIHSQNNTRMATKEMFCKYYQIGYLIENDAVQFNVQQCYSSILVDSLHESENLKPKNYVYYSLGQQFEPSTVEFNQLVPYAIICVAGVCKRKVHDQINNVVEIWDCQYSKLSSQKHYVTCQANNISQNRPKMLYYGEVRQNVTACMINKEGTSPDFTFCPLSFNINSTSVRVRLNVTTKNSPDKASLGLYNLQGNLLPIYYIDYQPDTLVNDYVWLLNITVPELELTTLTDVVYPDGVTRTVNAECYVQTNNEDYGAATKLAKENITEPFQIKCRQFSGTTLENAVYICQTLNFNCYAPLYGWTTSVQQLYTLNFTTDVPLILNTSINLAPPGQTTRRQWAISYSDVKYNKIRVTTSQLEPENYAFNPCKESSTENSTICSGIVLKDLFFACKESLCSAVPQPPKKGLEFSFDDTTIHQYLDETEKPLFSSLSKANCKFKSLGCAVDRQDFSKHGLLCNIGTVSCNGVTTTTHTIYEGKSQIATHSGSSVFQFETSDFSCTIREIKSYNQRVTSTDTNGASVTTDYLWVDLNCAVNNSQISFASATSSPNYLLRNSNGVDDVVGVLKMPQSDKKLQIVFTVSLLVLMVSIIAFSFTLSWWPGAVKTCAARAWNRCVCCEGAKTYCIAYDKYGIPLVDLKDQSGVTTVDLDEASIRQAANAVKAGFAGLTAAKLQQALHEQELEIVRRAKERGSGSSTPMPGQAQSTSVSQLVRNSTNISGMDQHDEIQLIFKKKRQERNRQNDWSDSD